MSGLGPGVTPSLKASLVTPTSVPFLSMGFKLVTRCTVDARASVDRGMVLCGQLWSTHVFMLVGACTGQHGLAFGAVKL